MKCEMCVFEMWDLLLWHVIVLLFPLFLFKHTIHTIQLSRSTQKMSKSKFHIWFCQKLCVLSQIIDFKWIMNDQRRLFYCIVWKTLKSSRLNKWRYFFLMLAVRYSTSSFKGVSKVDNFIVDEISKNPKSFSHCFLLLMLLSAVVSLIDRHNIKNIKP
jgi:hypothetical protein